MNEPFTDTQLIDWLEQHSALVNIPNGSRAHVAVCEDVREVARRDNTRHYYGRNYRDAIINAIFAEEARGES